MKFFKLKKIFNLKMGLAMSTHTRHTRVGTSEPVRRKTSPRRSRSKSPKRKTSPRRSPKRKTSTKRKKSRRK
tara:strand:- start:992 stop:1207 length:216 start_codon:yes stop_codon:yes gene_type:complete